MKIKFSASKHFKHMKFARAIKDGKIVGTFCFYPIPEQSSMKANGTEVLPSYQKNGIGQALWEAAIKKYKPRSIVVSTISDGGANLVKRMMFLHPEIEWDNW